MGSKLAFPVAMALAMLLLEASSALALGVQPQRAAERSNLATRSSSSLIAPATACPSQADPSASPETQQQSMRCMTDFARARAGLGPLDDDPQLDLSAQEKAADVLDCDSFSHTACGREFTYWMGQAGYISESCWHVGENLAWGTGAYGTVRSIFQAWMRSPGHRQNILGNYEDLGLRLEVGELEGHSETAVWAAHFGSHCGAATAGN
ncbi:MAG TPA: CAP domain-containing protein [Solirubrobacterales bacterium]